MQLHHEFAVLLCFAVVAARGASPNPGSVVALYTYKTKGEVWGTPAFPGNSIMLVNSFDRSVTGLRLNDGAQLWQGVEGNSLRGSLVVTEDGGVVDVSLSGVVTTRSFTTGEVRWTHQQKSGTWIFSPCVSNGFLFVPTRNDDLFVLRVTDGRRVASWAGTSGIWSAPLVWWDADSLHGHIVAAITAGAVVVSAPLEIRDGELSVLPRDWTYDLVPGATHYKQRQYAWIFGSPVLCRFAIREEPLIVFGAGDRAVRALFLNGTRAWESRQRGKVSSTPAVVSVDGGAQYPVVGFENGDIICFGRSGNVRWQSTLKEPIASMVSPASAAGLVVVGGVRGGVLALRVSDGSEAWRYALADCSVRSSPGLSVDPLRGLVIAVGCGNGAVHVLASTIESTSLRVNDGLPPVAAVPRANPVDAVTEHDVSGRESHRFTAERQTHVDSMPKVPTSTPIVIMAVVSCVAAAALYVRRSHFRKSKT